MIYDFQKYGGIATYPDTVFRKIFELMPFIVYIFDLQQGKNVFSNYSMLEILGYEPADIKLMDNLLPSLIHPDDIENVNHHLNQDMQDNQIYEVEYRMLHKNGEYIWLLSREAVFKRNHKNKVEQLIGTAINIDNRKRMETKLQNTQNQLMKAHEAAKMGNWVLEIEKGIISLSPQVAAMLGIVGVSSEIKMKFTDFVFDYVHQDEHWVMLQKLMKLQKFKRNTFQNNFTFKAKVEGQIKHLKIHMAKKNNLEVFGLCQDITKEIKAKRQIMEANKLLKKVNAELDQFVYRTSHNLRSPLASILGLINVMKLNKNDQDTEQFWPLLTSRVQTLDDTIQEINDYYKNARIKSSAEVFKLSELIHEIFQSLKFLDCYNLLKIEIDLSFDKVFSDKIRFKSILFNIISNCYKYFDQNKSENFIKIKAIATREMYEINISDNGIGIRDEHLLKVTEMFFRAHAYSQGTGLGLFIVKETMTQLKGYMKIVSKFGEGTTFILNIPKKGNSGLTDTFKK